MIAPYDLPNSFIRQLEGMTDTEVAVVAATYRSSCRRQGTSTHLILKWYRLTHNREEYESFLLMYSLMWDVVKVQRKHTSAQRPEARPVVGRRHKAHGIRAGFALAYH
jgi:hypothetical protein